MCVCVCVCVCVYIYAYICMYMCIYICVCIHVYMCVYMYICVCVCVCTYVYTYKCVYVYILCSAEMEPRALNMLGIHCRTEWHFQSQQSNPTGLASVCAYVRACVHGQDFSLSQKFTVSSMAG